MRLHSTLKSAEAASWGIWQERERQWPNSLKKGSIKWGEEFCTTLLLSAFDRKGQIKQYQFGKSEESVVGADWEWWVGSDAFSWRVIRVQAKIASPKNKGMVPHYKMLDYKVGKKGTKKKLQHKILVDSALAGLDAEGNKISFPIVPYYCLYHGWPTATPPPITWDSTRRKRHNDLMNEHRGHCEKKCPLGLLERKSSTILDRPWATAKGASKPGGTTPWMWWGAAGLHADCVTNPKDKLVSSYSDDLLPITHVILEELAKLCRDSSCSSGPGSPGDDSAESMAPSGLPRYAEAVANQDDSEARELLESLERSGNFGVRAVGILDLDRLDQ